MTEVIVYNGTQGVVVINPAPGLDPNALLATVPSGISGFIVDSAALPSTVQSLWALDGTGKITTNAIHPTADLINAERDRRLAGGFVFGGVVYQSGSDDIANITGACQLAFMSIVAGAKVGDYRWADASKDFAWIAADNTFHTMDAQTCVLFAKAAAGFRNGLIIAARLAKNALAVGQTVDIYADTTWGMDSTSPTSTAQAAPGSSQAALSSSTTPSAPSTTTAGSGASS